MTTTTQSVSIEHMSQLLKLISDPTRLTMLKLLQSNECCVCEFVEMFDISQPAVSQHLKKLKDGGMVQEKRNGHWVFYSLNPAYPHKEILKTILDTISTQDVLLEDLTKKGLRVTCN